MSAKEIVLRPITSAEGNALVRRVHYSGKVVNNSQLHIGVYYQGKLEGAMQFGPSLDKRKMLGLVEGTPWNGFLELNRMAFSDALPRNSESRALGIAMRLIRKHAPHVKWVVSFADGAQCGDGTIYRAAGFVLTSIKKNNSIWQAPTGETFSDMGMRGVDGNTINAAKAQAIAAGARFSRTSLTDNRSHAEQAKARAIVDGRARVSRTTVTKGKHVIVDASSQTHPSSAGAGGGASMKAYKEAGFAPIPGFQLRYLYFLDPTARERLTVPILPFSEIERRGAAMYKGTPTTRRQPLESEGPSDQGGHEGAAMRPVGSTMAEVA